MLIIICFFVLPVIMFVGVGISASLAEHELYNDYKKEADVLITYDEFLRYENMAPNKWVRLFASVEYIVEKGKHYKICFTSIKDWREYRKHINDRKENEKTRIFLTSVKKDIESYIATINEETQTELDKIKERIPKTEDGKQDIDEFFNKIKLQ